MLADTLTTTMERSRGKPGNAEEEPVLSTDGLEQAALALQCTPAAALAWVANIVRERDARARWYTLSGQPAICCPGARAAVTEDEAWCTLRDFQRVSLLAAASFDLVSAAFSFNMAAQHGYEATAAWVRREWPPFLLLLASRRHPFQFAIDPYAPSTVTLQALPPCTATLSGICARLFRTPGRHHRFQIIFDTCTL